MKVLKIGLFLIAVWIVQPSQLLGQEYVRATPSIGEGIWSLLRRSGVKPTPSSVAKFKTLNANNLIRNDQLKKGVEYLIPSTSKRYPIFGSAYEDVTLVSDQLEGHVYYIVGGHGGPDRGREIVEDEIAYDTALRLARELLADGATVHIIVRDPNDGIRDSEHLPADKDEFYFGGIKIVLNQANRLRTRARIINELYDSHRATAKSQQVIALHVDSYGYRVEPQVDVHFIVASQRGRELSESIRSAVKAQYAIHQPGRGYHGEIKSRDLLILRETKPTAILIELGNIRHSGDQHRLIKPQNRQTLAEWIKEGLVARATRLSA